MDDNVKKKLEADRAECLEMMKSENRETRLCWYYTHCGALEICYHIGLMNRVELEALEKEWYSQRKLL